MFRRPLFYLVLVAVLAIIIFVWLSYRFPIWMQQSQAQPLDLSTTDVLPHHEARLIQLDRRAIEQAYVQQVTFLFQQWMKDGLDQPGRALRGARQARSAYSAAMLGIEQREKAK